MEAIYLIYVHRKADIDVPGYGNFQNNEKQSSQFSHRINLIHCYVTDNSMSILCNLMRHIWFRRLHPASSMRKLFYFFEYRVMKLAERCSEPNVRIFGKVCRTRHWSKFYLRFVELSIRRHGKLGDVFNSRTVWIRRRSWPDFLT